MLLNSFRFIEMKPCSDFVHYNLIQDDNTGIQAFYIEHIHIIRVLSLYYIGGTQTKDPYKLLGVNRNASDAEIKEAYLKKVKVGRLF